MQGIRTLRLWKHRFASGKGKVALMLISAQQPDYTDVPILALALPGVLGPCFDSNLSFSPLLEAICARLTQETAQLCTSLRDLLVYWAAASHFPNDHTC